MPGEERDIEGERLQILELLEQGKITAAEAADLLAAVDQQARDPRRRGGGGGRWMSQEIGPPMDRARWFRVRVTDSQTGRTRSNVSVPIGMVGFGLNFARKFRGIPGMEHVDDLFEAVRAGRRGMIFDVASEHGERVEIFID